MPKLAYDLHIHSCLSPCGDAEMTPNNIAGMAAVKDLRIVALTDHNTARNAPAFLKASEKYGLIALPGMELTTQEEVHVVCLFANLDDALAFDAFVYGHLAKMKNKAAVFGEQIIMDENDEPTGEEEYLLINATDIPFGEAQGLVEAHGGVMIPAHIDKDTYSLIANLGFIPPDAAFSCAEVKDEAKLPELLRQHPYLHACRILHNSDAHQLGDISEPVHFLEFPTEKPTARDVLEALRGNAGER